MKERRTKIEKELLADFNKMPNKERNAFIKGFIFAKPALLADKGITSRLRKMMK